MASTKKQSKKISIVKALAWALFAIHQEFLGWLVITNFENFYAVLASLVSFGLTVISVGVVGAQVAKVYDK